MDEEEKFAKFDQDEEDFLEARIDNISVSNLGFIVFLQVEGDNRVLPIFIGANEAHSIAIAYNNQTPPRPLTHDLLKNILGLLDCEVVKVQVTALSDNTFYGRIHLKKEGIEDMDIDARPSDAIALALRYKVPIFVHKDVYESAAVQVKEGGDKEGNADKESDVEEGEVGKASGGDTPGPEEEAGFENQVGSGRSGTAGHTDPSTKLKAALKKALDEERYEEAAKIRDQLKRLGSGN